MSGKITRNIKKMRVFKNDGGGMKKPGLPPSIGRSVSVFSKSRTFSFVKSVERKPKLLPKLLTNLVNLSLILQDVIKATDPIVLNSSSLIDLINYFENKGFFERIQEYKYNKNTPNSIIKLKQKHFTNGTVRITKPGYYILDEDITFSPNETNDFQPTISQISSGQYPIGSYKLGFFAAITIETDNVVLDMNGKTIQQSLIHFLQQRFYSHIELASSPFINNQGPSSGISVGYKSSNNVLIMNGYFNLSSHHAIHSNLNNNIILYNLDITNFQVAGISLNGLSNSIMCKINVHDTTRTVPILMSYSHARFIRSFLNNVPDETTLLIHDSPTPRTKADIQTALLNDLEVTKTKVLNPESEVTIPDVFKNPSTEQLSDANAYGIALNITGVLVNDFLESRPETVFDGISPGNENIYMQDITIKNIDSEPMEHIVIQKTFPEAEIPTGYNSTNIVKGPVGDVFNISYNRNKEDGNKYVPNSIANTKAIIGKAKLNDTEGILSLGTAYFTDEVINWLNCDPLCNIDSIVNSTDNMTYKYGLDGMAHVMKGNIGLFLSGSKQLKIHNITVDGVRNFATNFTYSDPIRFAILDRNGAHAYGILQTATIAENIDITGKTINNIYSNVLGAPERTL